MGTPGLNAALEILGKRRLRASVCSDCREPSGGAYGLGVVPQTQYAKKGDAHIAYQIVGEGNTLDLVLVSTWFSHVEARWDLPGYAHYLRRLSSFSRMISLDKYGIGLSDPIRSRELPPLEDWMDDVSAVMDAVGLERAAIAGAGEASPMAELFAATYPERTSALVLLNATARVSAAPGYEIGAPPEVQEGLVSMVEQTWGRGDIIAAINPSLAGDSAAVEAWGRFLRLSASPATAAAVMRMLFELDVRDVLPLISVPTLVVHRRDNPIVTIDQGRYVAEHIKGARFVAVPGADYGLGIGDIDVLIDEVEEFLTGSRPAHATDRVLATVLFTDIVDSTPRAVELGDARWRELLESTTSWPRLRSRASAERSLTSLVTGCSQASRGRRAPFAARSLSETACECSAWRCVQVSIRVR